MRGYMSSWMEICGKNSDRLTEGGCGKEAPLWKFQLDCFFFFPLIFFFPFGFFSRFFPLIFLFYFPSFLPFPLYHFLPIFFSCSPFFDFFLFPHIQVHEAQSVLPATHCWVDIVYTWTRTSSPRARLSACRQVDCSFTGAARAD
jgi:hypothetical protein